MFFLELKCLKCKAHTELYSQPNQSYNGFLCVNDGCRSQLLTVMKAQSLDGKAVAVALQDLNQRLRTLEAYFEEASDSYPVLS